MSKSLKDRYVTARRKSSLTNDKAAASQIGIHHNTLATFKSGGDISAWSLRLIEDWVVKIEQKNGEKKS